MKLKTLASLSLLASCSGDPAFDKSNSEDLSGSSSTYYIGMSHDSDLDRFSSRCVTGEKLIERQTQSHWNFKQVEDWSSEKLALDFLVLSLTKQVL